MTWRFWVVAIGVLIIITGLATLIWPSHPDIAIGAALVWGLIVAFGAALVALTRPARK